MSPNKIAFTVMTLMAVTAGTVIAAFLILGARKQTTRITAVEVSEITTVPSSHEDPGSQREENDTSTEIDPTVRQHPEFRKVLSILDERLGAPISCQWKIDHRGCVIVYRAGLVSINIDQSDRIEELNVTSIIVYDPEVDGSLARMFETLSAMWEVSSRCVAPQQIGSCLSWIMQSISEHTEELKIPNIKLAGDKQFGNIAIHWSFRNYDSVMPNMFFVTATAPQDGYIEFYDGMIPKAEPQQPTEVRLEIDGGFTAFNISFRSDGSRTEVIGEMTNASRKNYLMCGFTISAYDANGKLLDTGQIMINNFRRNKTKSWNATFYHADLNDIADFKIDLESCFEE